MVSSCILLNLFRHPPPKGSTHPRTLAHASKWARFAPSPTNPTASGKDRPWMPACKNYFLAYFIIFFYFLLSPFSPSLLHLSPISPALFLFSSSLLLSSSPPEEVVLLSLLISSVPFFPSSISAASGYLVWLLSCLRLGILIYLPLRPRWRPQSFVA